MKASVENQSGTNLLITLINLTTTKNMTFKGLTNNKQNFTRSDYLYLLTTSDDKGKPYLQSY